MNSRVRKGSNFHRSEVMRERVRDHLMERGGRHGSAKLFVAKEDFVNDAIRTAKREGLRMWSNKQDDPATLRRVALRSLDTLLGEVVVITPSTNGSGAREHTGVNNKWVLDIWEATLDHLKREPLFGSREDEPEEATGPVVFATSKPLAQRILEAYLSRNDDLILELISEVEESEKR